MIAIWKLYLDIGRLSGMLIKFKVCFLLPIDFPYDSSMKTLWKLKLFYFFFFLYVCSPLLNDQLKKKLNLGNKWLMQKSITGGKLTS